MHQIAEVVSRRNEPMPAAEFEGDAFAIVTGRRRCGNVAEMPRLQAIREMGGRHPSPDVLDYRACFGRNIRVLSVAPAFGPMVEEMALAMALAAARDGAIPRRPAHTQADDAAKSYVTSGTWE